MLSSFFSKSKPINFIIVAFYMLLLFIAAHYRNGFLMDNLSIITYIVALAVYLFSMLLLNFIIQKNDLTNKSTHAVLLFAVLSTLLPHALLNFKILLSSFFVLLGLMSVLSFKDGKFLKAKILNASLCISLASLSYFWSVGFMILVFVGIWIFEANNYRNWLIPMVGWLAIFILANCFTLLFYDSFFSIGSYIDTLSLSFDNYWKGRNVFSVGTLVICLFFFFFIYLIKYKRRSAKIKPVLNLIITQLVIALSIVIVSPNKTTAELYFIVGPLAIIGATYLEQPYGKLVEEINIWVFLLLPFTLIFM